MIIDGKKMADDFIEELAQKIKKEKLELRLDIILAGDNSSSESFIKMKEIAGKRAGIKIKVNRLEKLSNQKLRKEVSRISKNNSTNGVIVQLPLPDGMNEQYILNAIPEEKDSDMISKKSWGSFLTNKGSAIPPSVWAFDQLMKKSGLDYKRSHISIVGYGRLVGKPISHWCAKNGATVSVINEHTQNPKDIIKVSDVVVSGVGKAGLITKDMIKEGALICDFGFSIKNEKIVGDFEKNIEKIAGWFTPVPGGMGPLVVAGLFYNLVELNKK